MEPEIRYTTTADGVSIAYYTMGEGLPLFVASNVFFSHLRLQPNFREYHRSRSGRGLGRGLQVIRYDARGTGLSDRNTLDFSMDARLLDLDAVVERLKLKRFAIFGFVHGAPAAIAYAARHPECVSHLILTGAYASGRNYLEKMADILMRDEEWEWERWTLNQANWSLDFSDSELARSFASLYRESMTPESVRAVVAAMGSIDVTSLLPRIAVPTLVMYRHRSFPVSRLEWSRELASKIPDARYVELAKRDEPGWTEEETRIVEDFLGIESEETRSEKELPSGTAIILFADIADSTALTERLGDAAFREKARELDEALRRAITSNGGTAIDGKLLGDGVLATFGAAREAIACAAAIHGLAGSGVEGRGSSPNDALLLHIGIHAGDVIREANPDGRSNVYGGAVNIASRVAGEAAVGETLVSGTVRDLARTSAGVSFEDRGERELKGVGEPVRVFAVRAGDL